MHFQRLPALTRLFSYTSTPNVSRPLSTTAIARSKRTQMPPRPRLVDETGITENFLKGSGPGGQKINKTSSAVQLIHEGSGIVVKCQETRSRSQNRIIARNLLANKLDVIEKGPMSRQQQLIDRKIAAKRSATKKARRKVADKSKPEGSLLNPFQDEFQDSNGVWVNAVVTEDDMKGHKLDPKRRINITTKEGKARPWDTEKPGMIEIEIEGGAKGGVLTGLDETKVIVAYQGLSGAEVDENGNVMESLHEHQVDENGNVTRYARTPLDISKWAPVGEEDIVPPKSSHVVPTRPRRKSVAFGHKREG